MKLKKGFILIFSIVFQNAFGTTFYAHPERKFEYTQQLKATFLLTESLHKIAMSYDSNGVKTRSLMLKTLSEDKSINTLLDIKDLDRESKVAKIRSALSVWLTSYPGSIIDIGEFQKSSISYLGLLELAFHTSRIAYKMSGLDRPRNIDDVINNLAFGPHDIYQDNKILGLRETMKGICEAKKVALDENSSAPKEFHWMRWVIKLAPDSLKQMAESFLGYKKNCTTLSRDVMDIVNPHFGPLRGSPRGKGQVEGLSVFLAKKVYSISDIENAPIVKALRTLRNISELDESESEEDAILHALKFKISNASLVNLFGLTTHNHGLEVYLMKGAIELINDSKAAVKMASEIDTNINHLYGLIAKHRKARFDISKNTRYSSLRINSERPYHYWGGAVVSCELVSRGYETWVASLSSSTLGKAYETMITDNNGESVANKKEDINLHIEGAQRWALYCR